MYVTLVAVELDSLQNQSCVCSGGSRAIQVTITVLLTQDSLLIFIQSWLELIASMSNPCSFSHLPNQTLHKHFTCNRNHISSIQRFHLYCSSPSSLPPPPSLILPPPTTTSDQGSHWHLPAQLLASRGRLHKKVCPHGSEGSPAILLPPQGYEGDSESRPLQCLRQRTCD